MDHAEKLAQYEDAILRSDMKRSESVYSKAADNFEDDLLEFEDFPEQYFEFVLKLLSEEQFYAKPGLWNFLLALSTEKEKLTPKHYERLTNCMLSHYRAYTDEDLCLAVCDFIARNCAPGPAKKLLDRLKDIEQSKAEGLRGFANDGLRILAREVARSRDMQ